jgi:hypothetical protein
MSTTTRITGAAVASVDICRGDVGSHLSDRFLRTFWGGGGAAAIRFAKGMDVAVDCSRSCGAVSRLLGRRSSGVSQD